MTRHYITVGCRYLAKLTGYEPADPKLAALALKVNCEFYMNAYVVVTSFLVFVIYYHPRRFHPLSYSQHECRKVQLDCNDCLGNLSRNGGSKVTFCNTNREYFYTHAHALSDVGRSGREKSP